MATLTLHDVPSVLIQRLEESAKRRGHSLEQEVRQVLQERYLDRRDLLERIRSRWNDGPSPNASQVDTWIEEGR